MATDLKTVQDHPATLLENLGDPNTQAAMHMAAGVIRRHEKAEGVTYATLDNDVLVEIKHAFDKAGDAPVGSPEWVDAMRDLYSAAQDLLGLSDD